MDNTWKYFLAAGLLALCLFSCSNNTGSQSDQNEIHNLNTTYSCADDTNVDAVQLTEVKSVNELNAINAKMASSLDMGDPKRIAGQVVYNVNGISLAGAIYQTRAESAQYALTIYANDDCFPIKVKLNIYGYTTKTQEISSYGTNHLCQEWYYDLFYYRYYYATVIIKPISEIEADLAEIDEPSTPPEENGGEMAPVEPSLELDAEPNAVTTEKPEVSVDSILTEKTEILVGALDLMDAEGLEEICRQDLLDYLSGEWDGSTRNEHTDEYSAARTVYARRYSCTITDSATGTPLKTSVSLDYVGELEVLAVLNEEDKFSLATDNVGLVEQWSLLEKQNSWQIALSEGDTVGGVLQIMGVDGQVAFVFVYDINEQPHTYILMSDGSVKTEFV